MGVRTTADEKIDVAQSAIVQAHEALNDVVFKKCWGADEYREEFDEFLQETYRGLSNFRLKFADWRGEN